MQAPLHSVPSMLEQATANPRLHQRLLHTHGQAWLSLLWSHCSFLLGPGVHKVYMGSQSVRHDWSYLAWMHAQSKAGITEDSDYYNYLNIFLSSSCLSTYLNPHYYLRHFPLFTYSLRMVLLNSTDLIFYIMCLILSVQTSWKLHEDKDYLDHQYYPSWYKRVVHIDS